jgi:hypothetical protein
MTEQHANLYRKTEAQKNALKEITENVTLDSSGTDDYLSETLARV